MIREDKFLVSRRPYAVDMGTLTTDTHLRQDGSPFYSGRIDAVWFRRRRGTTVASLGSLWDYQNERPTSAVEFLEQNRDGRYGGAWVARWDGKSYASEDPQGPEAMGAHLAILRPMLEHYPALPPGYSGWWRFETTEERRQRA